VQVTLKVLEVERNDGETTLTAQVGGNRFNGPSHFLFQLEGELVSRLSIRA
jgi:hypothetical protein